MNIRFFALFFLLGFNMSQVAMAWPSESITTLREQNYGQECRSCREHFSEGHCAPYCCQSCQQSAKTMNLLIPNVCSGICSAAPLSDTNDNALATKCSRSDSADSPDCDGATKYVRSGGATGRDFERRVGSCEEAVTNVNKYCTEDYLNSIYPASLFNLAKDIADSPSCNVQNVKNYNLSSRHSNPQQALSLCENNYNSCKLFCFDMNSIAGNTFIEGQRKYENVCQPKLVSFNQSRIMREEALTLASEMAEGCVTGSVSNDDFDVDDVVIDPVTGQAISPEVAKAGDGSTTKGTDATPTQNPNSMRNNPQVAMNNFSQIITALNAFLPSNEVANSYLGNVNRPTSPTTYRNSLTNEEYFGAPFEGGNTDTADSLDYETSTDSFDQPQSLKATQNNNGNQGRSGMGAGRGGLSMGGGAGRGSQQGAKNRGGGARRSVKDKTMFGKREGGGGSSGFTSSNQITSRFNGRRGSNLSPAARAAIAKKEFNASKYHEMIMSSYEKGLNSRAQKKALRRAAGFSDDSSPVIDGYTSWHLDNRIHPETVSLFMQTRMCYHTKYSSDFIARCERRR